MGKLIAVWGSPSAGKTTFSVCLAWTLCRESGASVLVVCPDTETPSLPVLFPNRKKNELFSLGKALSSAEITEESVTGQIVTLNKLPELGFLGYTDGENRYSYPEYDEAKAEALLSVVSPLADYTVLDCTSDPENPLTRRALKTAETVFRLASPDLKSLCWHSSHLTAADPELRTDRQTAVLNITDDSLCTPITEAQARMDQSSLTIPFSRAAAERMSAGRLWDAIPDREFNERIRLAAALAKQNE